MKKILPLFLILTLLFTGCSTQATPSGGTIEITDSREETVSVAESPKVVCLYGSYAEAWVLAGGQPIGVTQDALDRDFDLSEDVAVVGTVKDPNLESVIALDPDLVILSLDISSHAGLETGLTQAGISSAYFRVDTFEDYDFLMEQLCKLTGRQDLYEENVTQAGELIEEVKARALLSSSLPSVLLIRAFSDGVKAKSQEELAGAILQDLGCRNLADEHPSMLEDLSLEEIISADPEFIFVTTMGDEQAALDYLNSLIESNPAWSELSAVKEGHYIVLPKDLFHYKPNNRWGESYAYLAKILYPSLFD